MTGVHPYGAPGRVDPSERVERLIRLRVQLIWPEVAAFQIFWLVLAVGRGLDYLLPPAPRPGVLNVVEKLAPVTTWGAIFLAGGLLGLIGMRFTRWPLASVGHVICMACYGGCAVGALIDILQRSPIEGWRTPLEWAGFALAHWALADASIDAWRGERHRNAE